MKIPTDIDEDALINASFKLRKLRLTDVSGRKEHQAETVKSVLKRGLGGMYDDDAVIYILRHGIKYYLDDTNKQSIDLANKIYGV